jgi:hypothetical protein
MRLACESVLGVVETEQLPPGTGLSVPNNLPGPRSGPKTSLACPRECSSSRCEGRYTLITSPELRANYTRVSADLPPS